MGERYARDPSYGKPPLWGRLYAKHCPAHTDGCSRHVSLISEDFRDPKSEVRRLLIDAGYEPDHWASSMEVTVRALWEARAELHRLKGPEVVQREHDAAVAKMLKRVRAYDRRRQQTTEPTA